MPQMPRYPIFIPSKNRYQHERALTARCLMADGVDFKMVVEPSEADEYAKLCGAERLIILPRDDFQLYNARNFIKDIASEDGHFRHWQIDDNIRTFRRFYRKARRIPCHAGDALSVCEDFTDRYENIAISGLNYQMFVTPTTTQPFYLNVHVYSCTLVRTDIPNRWRGPYNDDTDLCLQVLADGWCTVLLNIFMADKIRTELIRGGNVPIYEQDGRLRMARQLERRWPGVVRVYRRWGRPQHVINWKAFTTPLKRRDDVDFDSMDKVDERGLRLFEAEPLRSDTLRAIMQDKLDEGSNR